jgi:hypothetical protein
MAMEAQTIATLDGLFKQQYSSKGIENLIPVNNKLQNMIAFNMKEKNGSYFNTPVILGLEHGVTYADEDDGAFALNDSIAGQMKNSQVRGFQMVLRSALAYSAAYRSLGSAQAFQDATKLLVANMLDSVRKKLEVQLMFGQSGIGRTKNTEADGSNVVVEIKAEYWAPGVWAGAEKMNVDFYDSTITTKKNTVPAVISAVDFDTQTITITTLTTTGAAGLAVGDVILPAGAKDKEMAGLHKILTNTGTLFGIDAAQYNLWKGNVFTPGSYGTPVVLTFSIIQQAISKAVEKGLDKDVTVLVNPGHWDDLLVDEAALRRYDSSYESNKAQKGSKSIEFFSQNGTVKIEPSTMVMEGFAYIICPEDFQRIGSTDVTFKRAGTNDQYFKDLENAAGVELRCYSDQALFSVKPARQILIRNLKVA